MRQIVRLCAARKNKFLKLCVCVCVLYVPSEAVKVKNEKVEEKEVLKRGAYCALHNCSNSTSARRRFWCKNFDDHTSVITSVHW